MTGRKNIYELITEDFDAQREINYITQLWRLNLIVHYVDRYGYNIFCSNSTIENFVDKYFFHKWKSRGFCITCQDMQKRLENIANKFDKETKIILYLEYYKNILKLFAREAQPFNSSACECIFHEFFYIMLQNINLLIEKLSLQEVFDKDLELIYLVPKSAEAIAAAEISTDKTGLAILKYHHSLLKGQLEEKRQILEAIATENEQLLKKPPQECKTLCDKTRGLINTMNIRHNNTKESEVFAKLSPKEQEDWYDEIYQMLLLCILENDNIARMKKVKQVFKDMKEE